MKQGIIIAGGKGTRMKLATGLFKPKVMVEVNGCPLLYKQIFYFITLNISEVFIVLPKNDIKILSSIIWDFFKPFNIKINFIPEIDSLGPGNALFICTQFLSDSPVLVLLGDTLVTESIEQNENWVGVVKLLTDDLRWCWVESENEIVKQYYDKVEKPKTVLDVVCGIYLFNDITNLKRSCEEVIKKKMTIQGEIQISSILIEYGTKSIVKRKYINSWIDLGTFENYVKYNKNKIGSNYFNKLQFNDIGFIKKSSSKKYFKQEIDWIQNLNEEQKLILPRIIKVKSNSYQIEFLDDPTLASIFYFNSLESNLIIEQFDSLLNFLDKYLWSIPIKKTSQLTKNDSCKDMYIDKTINRLEKWIKLSKYNTKVKNLINGNEYPSLDDLIYEFLIPNLKKIITNHSWCFIHGDLNFSNILVSKKNGTFKLIDPRGSFGKLSSLMGGDIRYEFAKLRHSYNGNYELYSQNLINLKIINPNSFIIQKPHIQNSPIELLDKLISIKYRVNLHEVKLIECSLFISMLPLHFNEGGKRDISLLINAILLIDKLFKNE